MGQGAAKAAERFKREKCSGGRGTQKATARQSVMPVPFVCVTRATKVTINVTQWPHEDELPDHKGSRKNPRVPKKVLLGFSDNS